jgi:quinol monooxygenase YgiN
MVLVTISITASARGRRDVLRALRVLAPPTRARPGCLGVHLLQGVDNRNAITWIEEWDSEDALKRHIRSDEYRTLLAVVDMSMREPEVRFHTIAKTAGMELIAACRNCK